MNASGLESGYYSELLKKVRCRLNIDLHPSKLASVDQGIREYLNGMLLRYNEDLDGVVLAYENEKVLSQNAQVHPYFPLTRIQIAADIVLFKPRPGAKLVGTINKIADGYIGLLVLGFMNAVVRANSIRSEFKPKLMEGCWASTKNSNHRLAVDDTVVFQIASLERHGPFLSLSGSLLTPDTGHIEHITLPKTADKTKSKDKKKKRKKSASSDDDDDIEEDTLVEKAKKKKSGKGEVDTKSKAKSSSKKDKKRKDGEVDDETPQNGKKRKESASSEQHGDVNGGDASKKKKKKSK